MKLLHVTGLLVILFLIIGCTPLIEGKQKFTKEISNEPANENKVVPPKSTVIESNYITNKEYSLKQLQGDIESYLPMTNLMWKESKLDSNFYYGNSMKYYVVQKLNQKITKSSIFYDQFSAQNWKGQLHFINETAMGWLNPLLEEKDFDNAKKYRDYTLYRTLVEQTTKETFLEVEHGMVLEYQHINWMFNQYGYFEGAWEDTLLIYKIYCSPDFVVFIRPKWDQLSMGVSGAKSETIHANWDSMINSVRKDMLTLADRTLENCPVEKEFFNDLQTNDFKDTKTLSYYYNADLEFYWDLITKVEAQVEPSEKNEGQYLLKRINVTITNNDSGNIYDFTFDVNVYPDGKTGKTEFVSDKKIATVFVPGKTTFKTHSAYKDFSFKNSMIIEIIPHSGWVNSPVRPTRYTLFNDGKIEKIK